MIEFWVYESIVKIARYCMVSFEGGRM